MFIDESHVTVPQVGAMYKGDRSRKDMLVDYGFRLPSARDNRPLKFEEFEIDGNDDLSIGASGIEGSLEINLIGSAAELRVPSGYAFRVKNAGRGCRIEGDFAETPDSGNVIELNGKDSTLTIHT